MNTATMLGLWHIWQPSSQLLEKSDLYPFVSTGAGDDAMLCVSKSSKAPLLCVTSVSKECVNSAYVSPNCEGNVRRDVNIPICFMKHIL